MLLARTVASARRCARTGEFEVLVGGGEGVGAIGEVSYGLEEEDGPDELAPPFPSPVPCLCNAPCGGSEGIELC